MAGSFTSDLVHLGAVRLLSYSVGAQKIDVQTSHRLGPSLTGSQAARHFDWCCHARCGQCSWKLEGKLARLLVHENGLFCVTFSIMH